MRPNPPRIYEYPLPDGWSIMAGHSESDNDRLSLKIAKPYEWWFHVRGMPGSHVILRAPEGIKEGPPDKEMLKQAAAVAAWHSKARNGGVVAVSATLAKFVSKPRGAKPGTVNIRKETVFKVRPGLPA
jgi:predicted ribosome quality control (RQC) complex YloA/Tae2 family protein